MARSSVAAPQGVDGFWKSERGGQLLAERVLPTGRAQVVVDLDTGAGVLVGPRTVSAIVQPPLRSVGFSLSGCGLARIVGGDAHLFVDQAIDLADLGWDLTYALELGCETTLGAFARQAVERYGVDDRIVAAEKLLRAGASASSIPSEVGFDRRKFVPVFRNLVGIAPKHYATLRRLQAANSLLRSGIDTPLALVAVNLGFSDQAHMSRDVRRLTAHTPVQVRRLPPGPVNHIPVDPALA